MIDFKTLLFPRRCPVCDRPVKPAGALVCRSCAPKLVYVRQPLCMKCGKELSDENQEYCRDCLHKKHLYDRGISLYRYTSVKKAVYRFKYAGRQEYAAFFGKEMAWHLGRQILSWKVDALVPVPLHPARKRKRGYNQALNLGMAKDVDATLAEFSEKMEDAGVQKVIDEMNRQIEEFVAQRQ